MPALLTDLQAGHQFQATTFVITPEMARAYRLATGDTQDATYEAGGHAVPPLAVAALALGEMLKQVALSEGTLHAAESLDILAVVPEGAEVSCSARLAQRSVRGGYVWSVLETVLIVGGKPAVTARATVLSPVPASS